MTLRRFVFGYAAKPYAWMDRYMAADNPANHDALLADPPNAGPYEAQRLREARTAWTDLVARNAAYNPLAPSEWGVAEADVVQADPTDARVPAQMRNFLANPPAGGAATFVHYADPERAAAYLREAMQFSPTVIAAMPGATQQRAAVIKLWSCLAAYFRALNVRPWGWAKYRHALETQVGSWANPALSFPAIGQAFVPNVINPGGINPPGNYPEKLFLRRPTPLDVSHYRNPNSDPNGALTPNGGAGVWRMEALARYRAIYGTDYAGGAKRVRFGTIDGILATRTPPPPGSLECLNIGLEKTPTGCNGPTGDMHPIWMTSSALLGGGMSYPPELFTTATGVRHIDCVRRSLVNGSTTGPNLITAPAGPNWLCGGISERTGNNLGEQLTMSPTNTFIAYLPPFLWYALLVWPLLQYLATVEPLAIVMEVQVDTLGKNLWTTTATGGDGPGSIAGVIEGARNIASSRAGSAGTTISTVLGAAAAVTSFNPIASGVLLLAAGTLNLVDTLEKDPDPRTPLDCFGRVEAAFDTLSIVAKSRGTVGDKVDVAQMIDAGAPMHPYEGAGITAIATPALAPGPVRISSGASSTLSGITLGVSPTSPFANSVTTSTALANAAPRVAWIRILGMPEWSGVYVDGEFVDGNDPTQGRWEDATQAAYLVSVPVGPHVLRVEAPNMPPWEMPMTVPPQGGSVQFGSMPITQTQPDVTAQQPPTGMSTGAKVGIVALILAAGIGGYVVTREK